MMMAKDNDKRINQKLKHFEVALGSKKSDNESYLEWVFQKLGSVNNQIAATNRLKLCQPEWIGSTELHIAYSMHDLKAFHLLLSHGADYTLKNQSGLTVLHLIMKSHSNWSGKFAHPFITAILSAHIQHKQSANPHDPNRLSHFHAACMADNVEALNFFLENSVSVNEKVNENSSYFAGYTPLHFAVKYLSIQVVEILLKHGANINLKDAEGMTPMRLLLKRNFEMINRNNDFCQSSVLQKRDLSEKITRLLSKNTGSEDTTMIDDIGLSCLHAASALMDLSEVEQLLEQVSNINHCVNVKSPLWAGYNALHFAAIFNIKIVKLLVKRGADLQTKDAKGVTPLDLCLERYNVEDIHSILSQKEEWKDITFSDGKTKLLDSIAAMISCEHFKKFLRKVTENKVITLPDDSPLWPGFTLMHLAVLLSKNTSNIFTGKNLRLIQRQSKTVDTTYLESIISALFEKNKKMVEAQDIFGRTPLHLGFHLGMIEKMANFLITLYLKLDDNPPDLIDDDNLSLLHIACTYNSENLVQKLLLHSNNSNLAYTGKSIRGLIMGGWTPLHLAVIQRQCSRGSFYEVQNKNVVKLLLSHGANINVKDSHELTPVHLLAFPSYYDRYASNNSIDDMLLSSPHLEMGVAADCGLSYLHVVLSRGKGLLEKLIHAGVDVNGSIKFIPKTYCDFYHWCRDITKYVSSTPLHIAFLTSRGRELVEFLIEQGADIFAKNSKGLPFLYEILETKNSRDNSNADKLKTFAKVLMENEDLRIKAEKDIGLTMLHVGCRVKDRSLVKRLLENGANVDAQIRLDSPIWPGYTPLHTLMRYIDNYNDDKDGDYILKLLLKKGADVTLKDNGRQTSLHMAYNNYVQHLNEDGHKAILQRPILMITTLKDFSINPSSIDGITHFHIACSLANIFSVRKFLNDCHIDVDQPIDFFEMCRYSECPWIAGCTPLHLAVMNGNRHWKNVISTVESTFPLEIVNLLLEHGANVNAENARGETPFAIADRSELLERLARGGANVHAKNATRNTPLEVFLSRGAKSSVIGLLRCGCHFNAFNLETEIGCIGLTMLSLSIQGMQGLVTTAMINFPELMVDEMSRTVIHNLVSVDDSKVPSNSGYIVFNNFFPIYHSNFSSDAYAGMIEKLAKMKCDVDAQDKLGRTALHVAVKFKNLKAISGLLLAGADINITDVNGQTPLAQPFHPCARCDQPTDNENEQCEHYKVFKLFALHVKKLQYCGLDVHPMNEKIVATAFSNFSKVHVYSLFIKELDHLKNIKIKSCPLTLGDFMSELDAVADYPTMSKIKANAIDRHLLSDDVCRQYREKLSQVAGLLKLQYRKAIKRVDLIREAKASLDFFAGTPVPELCSLVILRFLKNSELESMITAGQDTKKMWVDNISNA